MDFNENKNYFENNFFLRDYYNNKKNNLKIEMNKNSLQKQKMNLKIFICFCGKTYKSKENVVLHIKNIHLEEKPYSCEICHTGFSHRNGKNYHMRKFHTKILPYICTFNQCKIIL